MNKRKIIFCFFLSFGFILYLHNFLVYPPTRGLDSADHIAYIKYLAQKGKIPKANEGLQMYQPPLYYGLGAVLYNLGKFFRLSSPLKLVQLISLFSAFFNILLIYFLSKIFFKSKEIQILVPLFILFLPMQLYESPVISNEMLVSFLSTITLFYFLAVKWDKRAIGKSIGLGVFCGLACLTKYSGLVLFFALFISFIINWFKFKNKNFLFNALIFLVIVVSLSGWFYLRQYLLFGNPLILANDQKLFPYFQEPGYRDLKFYTNLNGLLPLNVFGAQMYSFWGGTYNTIWVDSHHTFLPIIEFSKAGAMIIYLALLPTLIMLFGFLRAIIRAVRNNLKSPYLLPITFSLLSFISYLFYSYKLPFGSSIKAFYLLSNILPMALYFGLGMEKLIKWGGKYKWLIYGEFLLLSAIIYKLYWYQSWWKNIG